MMEPIDLADLAREVAWYEALQHWYLHTGDMVRIVELLCENAPIKDHEARFLGAILSKTVKPRPSQGGTMTTLEQKHFRNGLALICFERVFLIRKWQAARHPEMRIDPRAEAHEYVAKLKFFEPSEHGSRDIVNPKKKKQPFRLRQASEAAKFRALYHSFSQPSYGSGKT